jgi:hypothetical protein
MEDEVEKQAVISLEHSAANLAYCSRILQTMEADDSEDYDKDRDNDDVECFNPEICAQLFSAKKNLLIFLDQTQEEEVHMKKRKEKWGLPLILKSVQETMAM